MEDSGEARGSETSRFMWSKDGRVGSETVFVCLETGHTYEEGLETSLVI